MAFSWFSFKKKIGISPSSSPVGVNALVVRTMQGDLERIERGEGSTPTGAPQGSAASSPGRGTDPLARGSLPHNPFSEENAALVIPAPPSSGTAGENPFGVAVKPQEKSQAPPTPSALPNGLTPIFPSSAILRSEVSRKRNIWLLGGSVALIMILAALGGYWYLARQNSETRENVPSLADNLEIPADAVATLPPPPSPYALEKPNYLSFNTETVAAEEIKRTLAEVGSRILAENISVPLEFLVTDQNNNPLAFSRFAFLAELELAPDLLALIEEAFSLYAYNDAGQVRYGLSLSVKDSAAAASLIAQEEENLPYALRTLVLEPDVNVSRGLPFRSSAYNQFAVRFANIDSAQNLSLDYAFFNNQWFIGTSKNTLRALLNGYAL